jgi:hypothetical protein
MHATEPSRSTFLRAFPCALLCALFLLAAAPVPDGGVPGLDGGGEGVRETRFTVLRGGEVAGFQGPSWASSSRGGSPTWSWSKATPAARSPACGGWS